MESKPVVLEVHLVSADEMVKKDERIKQLSAELDLLRAQRDQLEYRYRCESLVSLELLDLCKAYGVPVRAALESAKARAKDTGSGQP